MDAEEQDEPSHPLNVLHLVLSVALPWGGLATRSTQLARAQHRLGHRAAIWCLDTFPIEPGLERTLALETSGLRIFPGSFPARFGRSGAMNRSAEGGAGAAYDVLHQYGLWRGLSLATRRWRARHRRPTVVTPGGTLSDEAMRYSPRLKRLALFSYEQSNLEDASCLQAASPSEAADLRRRGLRNPIAVISGGVSDNWLIGSGDGARFRARFAVPGDRRLLLFLSRIHPKKGLPLLLEALAGLRLDRQGWSLVVAGPNERGHLAYVRKRAHELGIETDVHWTGPLEGEDKRDAFAAAEILVLPSLNENFGNVIAEALGAAVPVVTTRATPWEELLSSRCGWWVDASVDGLREALRDALGRSPSELREMGARGRELVARKYTWSRAAAQTVELYRWLLGSRVRPECLVSDWEGE